MKRSRDKLEVTDRLSALSEPIRLRIIRLLEAEELSVGEVARAVQLPQSTVSRHLKVLADGDWLTRRNEGTATYYRMVLDDLAPDARALWVTVRDQLGQSSELAEDLRRLETVIAERRTDSRSFFGRVAGQWDELRSELFGQRLTPITLLSLLSSDWVVADIGCGTGNASEWLAPYVGRVIAIDQSEPMLEAAHKRLSDVENVEFRTGQLEELPLEDASVDAAVCLLVLHHMDEPEEALREMRRVLRSDRAGGMALVVDMVEHDREEYRHAMGHQHLGFSRERIESMLREAGFEDVKYRVLPTETSAKGPGLFAAVGRVRD